MQDRLEATSGLGLFKSERAHRGAVEAAIRRDHAIAEALADGFDRGTARCGERVGDEVGVDDAGAERGEVIGGGALAAADAAGEADDVGACGAHGSPVQRGVQAWRLARTPRTADSTMRNCSSGTTAWMR